MANSVIGWGPTEANPEGTVSEIEWARIMAAAAEANNKHAALEGLVATPGASTRQVNISAGVAYVAGLVVDVDATTVTLPAYSGAHNSHDLIVLEVDWTEHTAEVKGLVGGSPVLAEATQTPGFWQMPIASVVTNSGWNAPYNTSHITARKPLPKKTRVFRGTGWETRNYLRTVSDGLVVQTPTIPDPGYPYRLVVDFKAHMAAHDGRVSLTAYAFGQTIANGLSDTFQANEENVQSVNGSGVSQEFTNPAVVELRITGHSISEGQIALQNIGYSHLTVLQIPA